MINPMCFSVVFFFDKRSAEVFAKLSTKDCDATHITISDEWHVKSEWSLWRNLIECNWQRNTGDFNAHISKTIDFKSKLRKFPRWIRKWSAHEVQTVSSSECQSAIGRNCKRNDCGRQCKHCVQLSSKNLIEHTSNAIHKMAIAIRTQSSNCTLPRRIRRYKTIVLERLRVSIALIKLRALWIV